jgi:hypothetical protein
MDATEWFKQARPTWQVRTPQALADARKPSPILGDEEAAVEWNEHPEQTLRRFVHMETYDDLRNTHSLFLFGRRGTGKTTYLNMLASEISKKEVPHYGTSVILQSQPLILGIAAQVRLSGLANLPQAELADAIQPVWNWIITVSAMHATIGTHEPLATEPVEVKQLRAFVEKTLPSSDVSLTDAIRDRMHDLLVTSLADVASGNAGRAFNNINQTFRSEAFSRAATTLDALMHKRPCLVLLDAGDVYAVRDPIPKAAITALISCLSEFANHRNRVGIIAKAAFPSEILPHVYPNNRGKMEGRIVIINWTYRDLVSLIAKRFATIANGLAKGRDLNDQTVAQNLIYASLPPKIETRVGISFDTLAYIVRHTQRTPRQVIMLMNGVLTHAKSSGWAIGKAVEGTNTIVEGVHSYLGHLVNDSIDMHRSMYDRLDQIVQGTLSQQVCYFRSEALGKMIKEVSFLRHSLDLERVDVVRLLFEIGVLGIAQEAHRLQHDGRFLLEALFEYQVKQALSPGPAGLCVVHPMFYEWLGTRVDKSTFVYPKAFENEERQILTTYGILVQS